MSTKWEKVLNIQEGFKQILFSNERREEERKNHVYRYLDFDENDNGEFKILIDGDSETLKQSFFHLILDLRFLARAKKISRDEEESKYRMDFNVVSVAISNNEPVNLSFITNDISDEKWLPQLRIAFRIRIPNKNINLTATHGIDV